MVCIKMIEGNHHPSYALLNSLIGGEMEEILKKHGSLGLARRNKNSINGNLHLDRLDYSSTKFFQVWTIPLNQGKVSVNFHCDHSLLTRST